MQLWNSRPGGAKVCKLVRSFRRTRQITIVASLCIQWYGNAYEWSGSVILPKNVDSVEIHLYQNKEAYV